MDTDAVLIKLDNGARLADVLGWVAAQLDAATGELALDFSMVRRIDSHGLEALENLVRAAEEKSVKVTLCRTTPGVYRVLKLVKLTPRLSFIN